MNFLKKWFYRIFIYRNDGLDFLRKPQPEWTCLADINGNKDDKINLDDLFLHTSWWMDSRILNLTLHRTLMERLSEKSAQSIDKRFYQKRMDAVHRRSLKFADQYNKLRQIYSLNDDKELDEIVKAVKKLYKCLKCKDVGSTWGPVRTGLKSTIICGCQSDH